MRSEKHTMDLEHLRGQSAFVTGAGSGIGRALTLELASLGVDVTVRWVEMILRHAAGG